MRQFGGRCTVVLISGRETVSNSAVGLRVLCACPTRRSSLYGSAAAQSRPTAIGQKSRKRERARKQPSYGEGWCHPHLKWVQLVAWWGKLALSGNVRSCPNRPVKSGHYGGVDPKAAGVHEKCRTVKMSDRHKATSTGGYVQSTTQPTAPHLAMIGDMFRCE